MHRRGPLHFSMVLLALGLAGYPSAPEARMSHLTQNYAYNFVTPGAQGTTFPNQYFVTDLNGDGKADIAKINCSAGGNLVFGYGQGAGRDLVVGYQHQAFAPYQGTAGSYAIRYGICSPGKRVELYDLNRDNRADIVIYDYNETQRPLKVFINNLTESGTFVGPSTILNQFQAGPPGNRKNVVRFGDVDYDSIPDLIRFDLVNGAVYYHKGMSICNTTSGCNFAQTGLGWIGNFAYEKDEPFLGKYFSNSGQPPTINGILAFQRTTPSNKYFSSVIMANSEGVQFETPKIVFTVPMGNAGAGRNFLQQPFTADMNNDGLEDIVVFENDDQLNRHNMYVALNNDYIKPGNDTWFSTWKCDECTFNEDMLWYSEHGHYEPSDTRPRVFGLGDVDGDKFVDYVVFPNSHDNPDAQVRYQMVVMLIWGISTTVRDQGYPGNTLGHNGGTYERWYGIGIKNAMDPHVSYDAQNLGDAHPLGNGLGNVYHHMVYVPGDGEYRECELCEVQTWKDWDDDGASDLDVHLMFDHAPTSSGRTIYEMVLDSKTEQENQGIYHRMRYGLLTTNWVEHCPWDTLFGKIWDEEHRDRVVVYAKTVHECDGGDALRPEARTSMHELGHALNLYHQDCEDQFYGCLYCSCGQEDRTVMGYERDRNEYSFWFSYNSKEHLNGQGIDDSGRQMRCDGAVTPHGRHPDTGEPVRFGERHTCEP